MEQQKPENFVVNLGLESGQIVNLNFDPATGQGKMVVDDGVPTELTRDDVVNLTPALAQAFDVYSESQQLRDIIDRMEQRHQDTLNQFLNAVLWQVLVDNNLPEIVIDTDHLALGQPAPLDINEAPGVLVYRLPEKNDD